MFFHKVAGRPSLRLAAALAALLAGTPPLLAQAAPGPLVTDRPDQTESTSVVPPGFVQLEAGWTVSGLPTRRRGSGSTRCRRHWSGSASGRLSAGVNLGLQWETESGPGPSAAVPDTRADWLYTAALGIGLSEAIGMFVEGFGLVGLEGSRPASHAVDGGFTPRLGDNLQLDLRAGAGLDGDAEDWFVGAGFAARLPR